MGAVKGDGRGGTTEHAEYAEIKFNFIFSAWSAWSVVRLSGASGGLTFLLSHGIMVDGK